MRDCGATTGFSVQVSILRRGELPNGAGNAFVADADHQDLNLDVNLSWESEDAVRLAYDPRLRTFNKQSNVAGVRLVYAESVGSGR